MSVPVLAVIFSVLAVVIIAGLAYLDEMLLPIQVARCNSERQPTRSGLPFITDCRLWGSLFFLTPALYIICGYINQFDAWLALTIILSCLAFFAYQKYGQKNEIDNALVNNGSTSPAGWLHITYFAVVMAFVVLFFFCSTPTIEHMVLVGVLLSLHILVTNHKVLMVFD